MPVKKGRDLCADTPCRIVRTETNAGTLHKTISRGSVVGVGVAVLAVVVGVRAGHRVREGKRALAVTEVGAETAQEATEALTGALVVDLLEVRETRLRCG